MESSSPTSSKNLFSSEVSRKWALAILLAVVVWLIYSPALRFSFLNYDDDQYVTANSYVRTGLNKASLRWALTARVAGHWQPVTLASHMLDCELYGSNTPEGHHLDSIVLHTGITVLLFFILLSLTRSLGCSFFVAALFGLHPVNIENVAWIAERKTLVSALFSLLAIAAYRWYARSPKWWRWVLVLVCFVLALASKATAITLPLIFLLFDYWPLDRIAELPQAEASECPREPIKGLILEKVPWFLLCCASAWIAIAGQAESDSIVTMSLWTRIGHAAWSYVAYALKLAWPSKLSILYPYAWDPWWRVLLGFAAIMAISVLVYRFRSKRYLVVGWLFYVIGMAPVIGFIQVGRQSFADHFLYLPQLGLFIMLAWGVRQLFDRVPFQKSAQAVAAAAVLVAMGIATSRNLSYWKDSYTVFARAESLEGSSDFVIENNLAQGLAELGRHKEAIPHYQKAIQLTPKDPLPRYNLAGNLAITGDLAGAIEQYQAALTCAPDTGLTERIFHNLGTTYDRAGDLAGADRSYSAALLLNPKSPNSLFRRGYVLYRQARYREASEDFARVVELRPLPLGYYWLGKSMLEDGHKDKAKSAFYEALRLDPTYKGAKEELSRLQAK